MRTQRKFLAWLMALILLVSMIPTALAEEPEEIADSVEEQKLIVALPDSADIAPEDEEQVEDNDTDVDSWENCVTCSEDNPHMIYTTADLDKIRTHTHTENGITTINGYFKLANDIVFSDSEFAEGGAFYNDGQTWIAIGDTDTGLRPASDKEPFNNNYTFCGTFDGDRHAVKNLKMCPATTAQRNRWCRALFRSLGENGTITNLTIEGATNTTKAASAIVVGEMVSSTSELSNITLRDCEIIPTETSSGRFAPNLLAYLLMGSVSDIWIDNCRLGVNREETDSKGNPWYTAVIATKISNCSIDGVKITDSNIRLVSYASLLFNNVSGENSLKNVEISNTTIKNDHYNYAAFIYQADEGSSLDMKTVSLSYNNFVSSDTRYIQPAFPDSLNLTLDNVSVEQHNTSGGNLNSNIWWKIMSDMAKANGSATLSWVGGADGNIVVKMDKHTYCIESITDDITITSDTHRIVNLNGGAFPENVVGEVGTLIDPIKSGYIFKGWYDNKACTGTAVTAPKAGKTYYAKWEECTHTTWNPATCTEPRTCSVCGMTEGTALGHSFTNYIYNNDATYDADGTKTAACDRGCGATDTVTAEGTQLIRASSGGGASGTPSHTVSVDSAKHGSVTVSPKSASKGTTVTITVKPDKGYELDDLTVTDKDGDAVKLTKKSDTKYTFTMPSGKVEVEATFIKIEEAPEQTFIDVPANFWAEDAIAWAYENGYMNGNTAVTFDPEGTVSRQQLWMILARLSGYNPAAMAEAKSWAVDNGISDGTAPGGAVSRQQLVTILYRYAVRMGYQTDRTADLTVYPDHTGVAAYAKDAMSWSVANSIVGGTTQGTLNPAGTATRAQFAVILSRFCENIAG